MYGLTAMTSVFAPVVVAGTATMMVKGMFPRSQVGRATRRRRAARGMKRGSYAGYFGNFSNLGMGIK